MFMLLGLFAIALAGVSAIESPLYVKSGLVKAVEVEGPAHYDFSYSVHDEHTGDIKSQAESRKGDVVQGQYSLIDADGLLRTVEYSSDAHNGFNAIVRREHLGQKAVVASPIAKIAAPLALPKLLGVPAKLPLGLLTH